MSEDADASEVEEITEAVEAKYPDVEVEVHEGNQPVYTTYYLWEIINLK